MKISSFIIALYFLQPTGWGQRDLLTVAKDGKWGLIKCDGTVVIPPVCDYIEYQSAGSKFVYDIKGKMGVFDHDGSLITEPVFDDITFFTPQFGGFMLDGRWHLHNMAADIFTTDFDSINVFENDILRLYQKDTILFFCASSSKTSARFYTSIDSDKDLLIAGKKDGLNDLLVLPDFNVVASDLVSIEQVNSNIKLIYFKDGMQLFSVSQKRFISEKYDVIRHEFESWFVCQSGSDFVLLDAKNGRTYKIPQTDEVVEISGNLMSYFLQGKVGVWNLTSEREILAPDYEGAAIQSGLIYTQNGDLFGLATTSGKEIFPTEYSNISNYGNVYVVTRDNKYGVATLSGKEIEPCVYSKIEVYDKNIKCYVGKKLVTLSVDGNGTVKDRTAYDEYMTLNFEKPRLPRQNAQSLSFSGGNVSDDTRKDLNRLGWYQTKFQREIDGVMKDFYGNWGMKDENDSIVIRARYKEIEIQFGTSYTIAYLERKLKAYVGKNALATIVKKGYYYKIEESVALGAPWFHIVNHRSKFVLGKEPFMAAQVFDFTNYSLARAVQKLPVLIDSAGTVVYDNLTYYDTYTEGHLRICEGGVQTPSKRPVTTGFSVSSFFRDMGFYHYDVDPLKKYFYIKGGKWYFVDRYGVKKNSQPFDFAFPFQNNRSIVLRKGKWGVVDTNMTEIVPITNQLVEQIYADGKTFFKVTNGHNQKYFYQRSASSYTETDYSVFSNYKNGLWFVKHPKQDKWAIMDTTLSMVMDFNIDAVTGEYGDYTTVSIDGKSYLLDKNGKIISAGFADATRIVPLKYNRLKIEKGERNFHIIDGSGNVLVPPYTAYEILASNENYIFYRDYSMKVQAWSAKNFTLPKKTILISGNPENELLLLQKGKKMYLYSLKTSAYVSSKPINNVVSLENEGYIFQNPEGLKGMVSYTGDTILPAVYTEINFNDRNWGIAKINYKEFDLIDQKGQKKYNSKFYEMTPISDRFLIRSENGWGLMDQNAEMILPCEFLSIATYYDDYYKTTKTNEIIFYSRSGKELARNQNSKLKGMPPNGWIIDHNKSQYFYDDYINPSLPFSTIIPVSSDGYILQETSRTGIYSYEGDTIVPPYYHSIRTDRELFQVRFFNSYGYFDHTGVSYFDPRTLR